MSLYAPHCRRYKLQLVGQPWGLWSYIEIHPYLVQTYTVSTAGCIDIESLCATMPQPKIAADEPAMAFVQPDYDAALINGLLDA